MAEHRTLQRSSELNNILEQFRRAIAETNGSKDAISNFSGNSCVTRTDCDDLKIASHRVGGSYGIVDCKWTASYIALIFVTSGHTKSFTILPHNHPFMHAFTHRRRRQPCKATASSSAAVRVRCLAQGHLGASGDRTSNPAVTSQPDLPPDLELLPALVVVPFF